MLCVLRVLTVFEPEQLNKDQYDWKASAKGASHMLAQEGKKAGDIKADCNCWLAGPYKAMHPTVVYPKFNIKAKEMRGSTGDFLRKNQKAFDWAKNNAPSPSPNPLELPAKMTGVPPETFTLVV